MINFKNSLIKIHFKNDQIKKITSIHITIKLLIFNIINMNLNNIENKYDDKLR